MKRFNSKELQIIIIAAVTQMATSFIGGMIQVALPLISQEMNLTIQLANWVSLSYMVALIAVSIPLGKVISKYGVKRYTIYGIIVLIAGLAMSALSFDINILLLSRVIQGLSVASLLITIYMFVVHQVSDKNIGSALGIVGSCGYIGMTSAPAISGFIVYYLSWRILFVLLIILFIIELIMLFRLDFEWKSNDNTAINTSGSLMYVGIMVMFIVGLNYITSWGIYALAVSIVLFILFTKVEHNKSNKIYNISLLKDFKYTVGNYAAFVAYFITFIATYIINFHLQYVMGYDSRVAGIFLLITPIIMVLVSPTAGKISDRFDSRIQAGAAMCVLFFVMLSLCFIDLMPIYILVAVMVVQGLGHGFFSPPNNKYVLTLVDDENLSDASSFLTTSKEVGKTVSLAMYNLICIHLIGNHEIGAGNIPALISSSHIIMTIAAVLTLSAIILLFYSKIHYH